MFFFFWELFCRMLDPTMVSPLHIRFFFIYLSLIPYVSRHAAILLQGVHMCPCVVHLIFIAIRISSIASFCRQTKVQPYAICQFIVYCLVCVFAK